MKVHSPQECPTFPQELPTLLEEGPNIYVECSYGMHDNGGPSIPTESFSSRTLMGDGGSSFLAFISPCAGRTSLGEIITACCSAPTLPFHPGDVASPPMLQSWAALGGLYLTPPLIDPNRSTRIFGSMLAGLPIDTNSGSSVAETSTKPPPPADSPACIVQYGWRLMR